MVTKLLGIGTFGKVYQCQDKKHKDVVAIKVVRKIENYLESASIEAKILRDVYDAQKKADCSSFVKMYSRFREDGHYFMVFEPLGMSVYDCIKKNNNLGLPLRFVRDIARSIV